MLKFFNIWNNKNGSSEKGIKSGMKKEENTINEKREVNKIKEDIKNALIDFCIENNIEDIKAESQNIFSAFAWQPVKVFL